MKPFPTRFSRLAPVVGGGICALLALMTSVAIARSVYVPNSGSESISVIDTATNQASPTTINAGVNPFAIAFTPDGKTAYVPNAGSKNVSVINLTTNQASPTPIEVGKTPNGIAITPDGKTAYVTNGGSESVSVIATATNTAAPTTIPVGKVPVGIAITPDGKTAYVANKESGTVSVINLTTNQASPTTIPVGKEPKAIAITPDGKTAYVANSGSELLSVIDLTNNQASPTTIPVGKEPVAIAITPDGKTAYVSNFGVGENSISVINLTTNQASPTTIPVGEHPRTLGVAPDQPPTASFSAPRARPGVPLTLDASASKDPDSSIATYAWDFGDHRGATLKVPNAAHSFASPGRYRVSLKEADAEGCSTPETFVFNGQSALCNGGAMAQVTKTITVAYPGVRVSCPRSAGARGCAFKLQAIAGKPRRGKAPKAESRLAKAKVKAGHSAIVSLKPTKAFAKRLAVARSVLLMEAETIRGSSHTRLVKLKIVQ